MIDIYGGKNPRCIPTYSARVASRYLNIPAANIRSSIVGYNYPITERRKQFSLLIETTAKKPFASYFYQFN